MIAKHDENTGLDDLLKRALADDLPGAMTFHTQEPPGAESGVESKINVFRSGRWAHIRVGP